MSLYADIYPVTTFPDLVPQREHRNSCILRLERLENTIRSYHGDELHHEWLNDYLDAGLELAQEAGERDLIRLQESWLRRIYNTLRDTGVNVSCGEAWRHQCLEYLYQPFFALQHLYRAQPGSNSRIKALSRDFSFISRYVI